MSRRTITNDQVAFVYGVDHATSGFIQVWALPEDDQDEPMLIVDNMGVRPSHDLYKAFLSIDLLRRVHRHFGRLGDRFQAAMNAGNPRPNITTSVVVAAAEIFGFHREDLPDLEEMWD